MKSIITIAILAAMAVAASSCTFVRINDKDFNISKGEYVTASGDVKTVEYTLPEFKGIDTWVSADIDYVVTAGEPSVRVSAPESIVGLLTFDVEDGILLIRSQDNKNWRAKVTIQVQSATLESLAIRGAGDFTTMSAIRTESLGIDVKGAGDIDFAEVTCDGDVSVTIAGAGDIGIDQLLCNDVNVDVMGAGDVRLGGTVENANLSIKGAGDIDIRNLTVNGNVSSSVAGVGSVKKK